MARSRFAFAHVDRGRRGRPLGPWLGALADYKGGKKAFLGAFLALGAALTAAPSTSCARASGCSRSRMFAVGNVAVTSTLAFYNSLLPGIAAPDEVDRVSTAGFALGYLGGGALFALNWLDDREPAARSVSRTRYAAFRVVLPDASPCGGCCSRSRSSATCPSPRRSSSPASTTGESAGRIALRRLAETFRELRVHKDAGWLLLAFLVYNDAVNTIIRDGHDVRRRDRRLPRATCSWPSS